MTAARRIVSGNIAGLASIATSLVLQVAAVPIFLGGWGADRLATWIALTTAFAFVLLLDIAHLDYLGFECMKLPVENREGRNRILSDAAPMTVLLSLAEAALVAGFLWSPWAPAVFGVGRGSDELAVVRFALLAVFACWIALQGPVGLIGRGLSSIGHFAVTVWWYLVVAVAQGVGPMIVVLAGGGLRAAVGAYFAATIGTVLLNGAHYQRLARREGLRFVRPNLAAGATRLRGGLLLGVANVVEYLQQAGFRLVLLPFLGAARLVAFTTLRTVAGVVQQGLIVLANPMLPELMRFVSARDRRGTGAVMSAMLYITVVALCPGLVVLQAIVRPVYAAWTLGKLPFDALAFTMLSTAVLVAAWSQASRAVARGNNLVGAQTAISVVTGVVLLATTFLTAPGLGIRGAALGVLLAEVVRAGAFYRISRRWFGQAAFDYPTRATAAAALAVAVTTATVFAMALWPDAVAPALLGYAAVWIGLNLLFWRALCEEERQLMTRALGRLRARLTLAAAK